jgi:hypothetical protein
MPDASGGFFLYIGSKEEASSKEEFCKEVV